MKGIHATSDIDDDVDGHSDDAPVSESKSKSKSKWKEEDFDFSSRGIISGSAAADLDFVQASLRAESRGTLARYGTYNGRRAGGQAGRQGHRAVSPV